MRPFHIDKYYGKHHRKYCRAYYCRVGKPVECLSIYKNVYSACHHRAEHSHIAELAERYRETPVAVSMVRHRHQYYENGHKRHAHHVVIYVLPLIFVCQPGGERCAQLSQNHEEQIYYWHALALLRVQTVPSFFVGRLVAGRYVLRGLHSETVAYECEQIHHHEHHAQKTHHEAAQGQHEYAVGHGAYVAENIHHGESDDAHYLLPAYAHQLIEERREGRHAYRCDETDELYVFRLYAQSAHHLAAVGSVNTANGENWYEQKYQ